MRTVLSGRTPPAVGSKSGDEDLRAEEFTRVIQNPTMPPLLSSDSPIPLYFQLSLHLRNRIRAGEFDNNSPLPPEDQLCNEYSVSRTTVRQAMGDLSAQRLIVRRRGLGTFVAEATRSEPQVSLVGSIHRALHYVKGLTYENLSKTIQLPPQDIREKLRLSGDEQIELMTAIGMLQGEPLVHANLYFPLRFGKLLTKEDFTTGHPVVHILEKRIGASATRAEQTVDPDKADGQVAAGLGVARGTAILKITRVFYLPDGTPLEAAVTRYHPQRYRLQVELVERPPQ